MYRVHTLPVNAKKDRAAEEINEKDGSRSTLHSVADSLVLLQALRQSRQTWLTSAFVKFSTKSRGSKGSDIWQPPHTIRFRGKCDLEIGPHVFYATSVYEVTYQPYSVPVHTAPPYDPQKMGTPASLPQPSTSQGLSRAVGGPIYAPSATALISSLKGAVPVTADLIAQVNSAAVSNPTLANLLGLAASGSATPEQLQTLGITIQSLADTALKSVTSSSQTQSASTSSLPSKSQFAPSFNSSIKPSPTIPPTNKALNSSPASVSQPPVLSLRPPQPPSASPVPAQVAALQQSPQTMQTIQKDPDVVIEFYENSYDRWTLPKELVLYERVQRWDGNNSLADIIFSTIFPFEGSTPSAEPQSAPKDAIHPITLRFFNVPPTIWNLFAPAAGDEERTKRVKVAVDSQLDRASPRAYLQHQITDGSLLTQLQASASDRYPTKFIRPTNPVGGSNTGQGKRRASAALKGGSSTGDPPPKRKRPTQTKKTESRTGTCDICKRASVVLAPGSPYCPPCTKKVNLTATTFTTGSSSVVAPASGSVLQPQVSSSSATSVAAPPVVPTTGTSDSKMPTPSPIATVVKNSPSQTQLPESDRTAVESSTGQTQPSSHSSQHPATGSQAAPSEVPTQLAEHDVQSPLPLPTQTGAAALSKPNNE